VLAFYSPGIDDKDALIAVFQASISSAICSSSNFFNTFSTYSFNWSCAAFLVLNALTKNFGLREDLDRTHITAKDAARGRFQTYNQ
jgi:hypothetical protein